MREIDTCGYWTIWYDDAQALYYLEYKDRIHSSYDTLYEANMAIEQYDFGERPPPDPIPEAYGDW